MSQVAEKGKERELTKPLSDGLIRPKDDVTVYATGAGGLTKVGEPMEVHTALADKLVLEGKATFDPPAEKLAKNK